MEDNYDKPSPYDVEAVRKWIEKKKKQPAHDRPMTKEEIRQLVHEEVQHQLDQINKLL